MQPNPGSVYILSDSKRLSSANDLLFSFSSLGRGICIVFVGGRGVIVLRGEMAELTPAYSVGYSVGFLSGIKI